MSISRILFIIIALLWTGCVDDPSHESAGPADTEVGAARTDSLEMDTVQTPGGDEPSADTAGLGVSDTTEWMTDAVDVDRSVPEIGVVDELRSATHADYDRLVVEFQGSVVPGYHVSYLDEQPIECGSGHPVEVAGNAVLEIRLQPARGHDEQGRSTVDHDERSYDMPVLREAEITCDFEAMFTIVLGLQERRPFRVTELASPPRLVVDIKKAENE